MYVCLESDITLRQSACAWCSLAAKWQPVVPATASVGIYVDDASRHANGPGRKPIQPRESSLLESPSALMTHPQTPQLLNPLFGNVALEFLIYSASVARITVEFCDIRRCQATSYYRRSTYSTLDSQSVFPFRYMCAQIDQHSNQLLSAFS